MLRKLSILFTLALALVPWQASYAQDPQPSLGDVARQARKDKENKKTPPKAVITEDTLPSSGAGGGLAFGDLGVTSSGNSSSKSSASSSAEASSAMDKAIAKLDQADAALNRVAPMDRTMLAKLALQDDDVNFPGRREWETKLYDAKQIYVAHGHDLLAQTRELLAEAQAVGDKGSASERSALMSRLQSVMQDANRTEAAFMAIIMEGKDLAKQSH